jgi:N-formylglutamate amidohydrolase
MTARIVDELEPPHQVSEPAALSGPVVCNSPHSGRSYLSRFIAQSRLDLATLRRSEDTFVDELFTDAVKFGVPIMSANFPRAFLDVNREPYELDPRMFEGRLPAFANTRSLRVAGGLGTIARVVGDAREIYNRRIPVEEALARIELYYKPYHRTLRRMIVNAQRASASPSLSIATPCRRTRAAATSARAPTSCSATATARVAPHS